MNGKPFFTASRRPVRCGPVGLVCLSLALATTLFVLTVPAPAVANDRDATLEIGDPYVRNGTLCFDIEVTDLFGGEAAEALHSGLPATVIVQWGIWRQRHGWWDDQIVSGSTFYRVFYDVLQERYDLFDRSGRPLASSDHLGEIEHALCRRRGLTTVRVDRLDAGAEYVIEILARLEPLDEQEIEGLEDWARGDRGDREFLSGISRRAKGWLKNFVGPETRSAWARSETFSVDNADGD